MIGPLTHPMPSPGGTTPGRPVSLPPAAEAFGLETAAGPAGPGARPMARGAAPGTPRPDGSAGAAKDPTWKHAQTSGDETRLLALLADRTRLRILRILAGGERPVISLTTELGLPQPTVSHHLAWLRMMDLVSPRRQGKHVYYSLGPAAECDEQGTLTLRAANAIVTITPTPAAWHPGQSRAVPSAAKLS